jgi:hypothetical protein
MHGSIEIPGGQDGNNAASGATLEGHAKQILL